MQNFKFYLLAFLISSFLPLAAQDVPENPLPTPGRGGEIHDVVDQMVKEGEERRKIQNAKAQAWLDERMIPGHTLKVLPTGKELHIERVQAILAAKHSIYLSAFAFYADEIGGTFGTLLCKKAQEGLDVRLMVDTIGARKFKSEGKLTKRLRDCGIPVLFFNNHRTWGLNNIVYVIHEKLLIVDGETVILGGSGWARHYTTHSLDTGWRDLDARIDGPAACYFHNKFLESIRNIKKFENGSRFSRLTKNEALKSYGKSEHYECEEVAQGDAKVFAVHSNPFFSKDRPILAAYATMMQVTGKGDINLYAPYFIPHKDFSALLSIYALLGRNVNIITNSIGSNDDGPKVVLAMYKTVRGLMRDGVKIHLWQKKSTMHRKGGIIGGKYAYFGSDNLDRRGQNYSSESIAITDDAETVKKAQAEFDEDLKHTILLTEEIYKRDWKSFGRLMKFYIDYIIDYM